MLKYSPPKVFLEKGFLNTYSKFTGEHLYQSAVLVKLQSSFIEIALRYGCSAENLLYVFRTSFPKNTLESYF